MVPYLGPCEQESSDEPRPGRRGIALNKTYNFSLPKTDIKNWATRSSAHSFFEFIHTKIYALASDIE